MKSWRVNGAEHVTVMEENGNEWRVLVGKPECKVTTARHEYKHLTSADNSLIRVNSIALWRSAVQKNFIFSGIQIILRYLQNLTVSHINPVHSFLIHFNTKHPYVKPPYLFTLYRQHFEYICIVFMRKYEMTWKKTGVAEIRAVSYNCPEVKVRTMYKLSHKIRFLVNILS